jgi:hypothetical protein
MKLTPSHLRRYKDLALLFIKYGRGDLARHIQKAGADFPEAEPSASAPDAPVESGKPEHLAADLERMGPTFIKLGQVLAGRPDLLTWTPLAINSGPLSTEITVVDPVPLSPESPRRFLRLRAAER